MTLREISDVAGVATSTVSLVLNNKPGVRKDTRDRITKLLLQNGYTIRNTDSGDSKGEIKFLRYIASGHISERNEDFYVRLLNGAESRARQEGYNLSIANIGMDELPSFLSQLENQHNILGVLVLASELQKKDVPLFYNFSLPLIFLDRQLDEANVNTLATSNIAGAYEAVHYLYSLGHRKIGMLRGQVDIGGIVERSVGYRRALRDLNLPYNENYIVDIDIIFNTAVKQMEEYLDAAEDLPTAFFAANDIIAAGCIRAIQDCGYRVPEDISVLGFDDGSICSFTSPPITTMRVPCDRIGAIAVERLLSIASGSQEIIKSCVSTTLIERQSTAPLQG